MVEISIIVVIYNKEAYLDRCIDSIIKQTYSDFEIILVDDGSKDTSLSVARTWSDKYDNIRVFTQCNKGVSAARNKGLDMSTGRLVCFVDPDDYVMPKYLEHLLTAYTKGNGCGFSLTGLRQMNESGMLLGDIVMSSIVLYKNEFRRLFTDIVISNYGYTCAKLYDRKTIEDNNLRFANVKSRADLYFMLSYIQLCDFIAISDNIDYVYIRYDNSVSSLVYSFEYEFIAVNIYRRLIEELASAYSFTYNDIPFIMKNFMINIQRAIKADYQPMFSLSISERVHNLKSIVEQNRDVMQQYYHPDYLIDKIGKRLLLLGCFRLYDLLVRLVFFMNLRSKMFLGPR